MQALLLIISATTFVCGLFLFPLVRRTVLGTVAELTGLVLADQDYFTKVSKTANERNAHLRLALTLFIIDTNPGRDNLRKSLWWRWKWFCQLRFSLVHGCGTVSRYRRKYFRAAGAVSRPPCSPFVTRGHRHALTFAIGTGCHVAFSTLP